MLGNQHIKQIADCDSDSGTIFDLGELQEPGIDQKVGGLLKVDFDRDNGATVAITLSAATSAGSSCHHDTDPLSGT
jgi:hypothetical protein